jgi:OOP family OmpA-OmpF porin
MVRGVAGRSLSGVGGNFLHPRRPPVRPDMPFAIFTLDWRLDTVARFQSLGHFPMKTFKRALLTAAILATSLPAQAADSGFYLTAGLGISVNDARQGDADQLAIDLINSGYSSAEVEIDKAAAAGKIGIGYKFNRYLAIDLAYMNLGTFETRVRTTGPSGEITAEDQITGTAFSIIGMLPVSENWSVFGRAGSLKWKETIEIRGCAVSCILTDMSTKGRDGFIGFGGNWEISERWGLTAEWDAVKLKYDDGSNAKLKTALVSGRYKF